MSTGGERYVSNTDRTRVFGSSEVVHSSNEQGAMINLFSFPAFNNLSMFNKFLDSLYYLLTVPVMPVGKTVVTVWMLLYVGILLALLILVARLVRDRALYPALAKSSLDAGAQIAIALGAHYLTVGIGALIILNTAGRSQFAGKCGGIFWSTHAGPESRLRGEH